MAESHAARLCSLKSAYTTSRSEIRVRRAGSTGASLWSQSASKGSRSRGRPCFTSAAELQNLSRRAKALPREEEPRQRSDAFSFEPRLALMRASDAVVQPSSVVEDQRRTRYHTVEALYSCTADHSLPRRGSDWRDTGTCYSCILVLWNASL